MTPAPVTHREDLTPKKRGQANAKKPFLNLRSLRVFAVKNWWKREWALPLALFLVLRLVASALGYVTASGPDPEPLASGPIYAAADSLLHTDRFSHLFVNVWERWDTGWYLKIAAFGYDQALAKGNQSVQAQTGILVGWVAPTGVLLLLCFFALALYPLAGEKWEEIKKQLSFRHREKERKYLEEHGYKFVE